jgi:hypothetical protein
MKRILTISTVILCLFQACHKQQDFTPVPIGFAQVGEDSNLIIEQIRLEKELFSQIYYANLQLAKQGRIVVKQTDPEKIHAVRASDPVNQ